MESSAFIAPPPPRRRVPIPSLVAMVVRAFGPRVTATMAAGVAVCGLLGGIVLAVLGG